jgi:hypothetical protein
MGSVGCVPAITNDPDEREGSLVGLGKGAAFMLRPVLLRGLTP